MMVVWRQEGVILSRRQQQLVGTLEKLFAALERLSQLSVDLFQLLWIVRVGSHKSLLRMGGGLRAKTARPPKSCRVGGDRHKLPN